MPLLKHPTAGRVVDVNDQRAETLRDRGWLDYEAETVAPSAVQPQPPVDARPNPPEPPVDARPDELINDPPIDTRPPNPLGPVSESVAEADGAGLDDTKPIDGTGPVADGDADDGADQADRPAKSASKGDWVEYAEALGVEDADSFTKDELIDKVG